MSLAIVHARAELGVEAPLVTVEVHLTGGLPKLVIVGLPETTVRESGDRVRSAILNSGHEFPRQRITVNLAPADLPKHGGRFDLAIAVGILRASGQLPAEADPPCELVGELALGGMLRRVGGTLPAALRARDAGRALVVSAEDAAEAALVPEAVVFPAGDLRAVVAHLAGARPLAPHGVAPEPGIVIGPDLADVRGQHRARRALEIAAAGGHNLLLIGPPGTGKTMLASRLPGLLPPMSEREALETAAVMSVSGERLDPRRWAVRPFRAPHHTASAPALVGGGSRPRPGEISLAHHGVLFLDELPEYDRRVLEALREPLESGSVTVARAGRRASFPARFQLVAAMNPCPCGHLGDGSGRCGCSSEAVRRYRSRVSGPLLDRIDLQVETPPYREQLGDTAPPEPSAVVRARVEAARRRQLERGVHPNARLDAAERARWCTLDPEGEALLDAATDRLGLSARGRARALQVARTVADLAGDADITGHHLAEAVSYRQRTRYEPR